jgi:uncharacterized protein YlbG (UPF0298 family)
MSCISSPISRCEIRAFENFGEIVHYRSQKFDSSILYTASDETSRFALANCTFVSTVVQCWRGEKTDVALFEQS